MKFGCCVTAFIVGCLMTVLIKGNPNHEANAGHVSTMVQIVQEPVNTTAVKPDAEMQVETSEYGQTKSGEAVQQYVCSNKNGYVLTMIDYGATVTSFEAPDRHGDLKNITLGCNEIAGYETCTSYLGASIGRCANRIADAKFSIDGREFRLAANNGPNHLHGGKVGFDKRVWRSEKIVSENEVGVRFKLNSTDGDEGYPGNLDVQVDYVLDNNNELRIEFTATGDQKSPVNLTNHCYWNLAGAMSGKILDHQLQVFAEQYLAVDETSIPTETASVANTPFDFRQAKAIGSRFDQLKFDPLGYDHCFVLSGTAAKGSDLKLAACVSDPGSGRTMKVLTNQPGIQFYTGNYLNGQPTSGGFNQHQAFCLETQAFPDAINRPDFPSVILEPGKTYHQRTVLQFGVE